MIRAVWPEMITRNRLLLIIAALSIFLLVVPWKFVFYDSGGAKIEVLGGYSFITSPIAKDTQNGAFYGYEASLWSTQVDTTRYGIQVFVVFVVATALYLSRRHL